MGFPQSMSATLRYVEKVDFVLDDTLSHYARWRANDLYNPRVGGGVAQPRGFAQFMYLYNTFTVKSSRIRLNWVYEGYMGPTHKSGDPVEELTQEVGTPGAEKVPALPAVVCGVHKGTEPLSAGAPETQMEKDRTHWKLMTPFEKVAMGGALKTQDFFGKDFLVGSAGYTGTDAASPTNDIFWEVWAGRAGGGTPVTDSNVNLRLYATIEYDAVFTNPKTLGPSPTP